MANVDSWLLVDSYCDLARIKSRLRVTPFCVFKLVSSLQITNSTSTNYVSQNVLISYSMLI